MNIKLTNKVYDILKWLATYLLPAAGTLYFALARIWQFPFGSEVIGTIAAIDTFLGVILGLSKSGYQGDGQILVDTTNPDKDVFTLQFDDDDFDQLLRNSQYVTFKVNYNPDLNNNEVNG